MSFGPGTDPSQLRRGGFESWSATQGASDSLGESLGIGVVVFGAPLVKMVHQGTEPLVVVGTRPREIGPTSATRVQRVEVASCVVHPCRQDRIEEQLRDEVGGGSRGSAGDSGVSQGSGAREVQGDKGWAAVKHRVGRMMKRESLPERLVFRAGTTAPQHAGKVWKHRAEHEQRTAVVVAGNCGVAEVVHPAFMLAGVCGAGPAK